MKKAPHSIRLLILATAGAVLALVAAVSYLNTRALEQELVSIAETKAADLARDANTRVLGFDVTAARKYAVLGEATGKVTVYVAAGTGEDGERYYEHTYFHDRVDGSWKLTESAVCSDDVCQLRAREMDGET